MSNFTLEDLKTMARVYEPLMEKANKMVKAKYVLEYGKVTRSTPSVWDIDEINEDNVRFKCEDDYGDSSYETIPFEDLLLDEEAYLKKAALLLEEKKEKERLARAERDKEYAKEQEEHDLKNLLRLQKKYAHLLENGKLKEPQN